MIAVSVLLAYATALFLVWFRLHHVRLMYDKAMKKIEFLIYEASRDGKDVSAYFNYVDTLDYTGMLLDLRKWSYHTLFPELAKITGHVKKSKKGRWPWVIKHPERR